MGFPEWRFFRELDGINRHHPSLHKLKLSGLKDHRARRVLSMLEVLVIVGLPLNFFSPFIISKFFISGGENAGSFNKLKFGLPKLGEGFIGFLLNLLQCPLGSCCTLFHYIQPKGLLFEAASATYLRAFSLSASS